MRERLDNSLVASLDTSAEKVLQFLGQEEDMLDQHKDRCTKLTEYQVSTLSSRAERMHSRGGLQTTLMGQLVRGTHRNHCRSRVRVRWHQQSVVCTFA